jgi:hypothetical protein
MMKSTSKQRMFGLADLCIEELEGELVSVDCQSTYSPFCTHCQHTNRIEKATLVQQTYYALIRERKWENTSDNFDLCRLRR